MEVVATLARGEEDTPVLPVFLRRTNTIISGPTSSGKTVFLKKVLASEECFGGKTTNGDDVYEIPKVYVLTAPQSAESWKKVDKTVVISDLPSIEQIMMQGAFDAGSVVVIDDMMSNFTDKTFVKALAHHVSVNTHHRDLYTFILTQDFFHGDTKTIRRNVNNFVLFKQNARGLRDTFSNLAKGAEESRLLMSMYEFAVGKPYRPLVLCVERPSQDVLAYAGLDGILTTVSKTDGNISLSPVKF